MSPPLVRVGSAVPAGCVLPSADSPRVRGHSAPGTVGAAATSEVLCRVSAIAFPTMRSGGVSSMFSRFFAVLILVSLGAAWADQVVMKNGDRVTGAIVKQDGKTITVKTDVFGVVTASWDQVASLRSDQPINIVLKDGKTLTGTVAWTEGQIDVTMKDARVQLRPDQVVALRNSAEEAAYQRLLNPGMLQLWAGGGSLGWAGTAGNAKTLTFTTSFNAARLTNTDKTSIYFNLIKASALINGQSATTAQAVRGGISYDHNANRRLFVNVFNDYEYDRFQDLDLRFVIGGGLGFHAVKTETSKLDLLAGLDYNHSAFGNGLSRSGAEVFGGDEYTLKLTGASSVIQSFRIFQSLQDTAVYRVNFDLGIATKLRKWLTWNVSLSDRYLSRPVPGRKTNDFLYTTGLGLTFGR
jgi:putative salt-induced outer membrane protein YdiY